MNLDLDCTQLVNLISGVISYLLLGNGSHGPLLFLARGGLDLASHSTQSLLHFVPFRLLNRVRRRQQKLDLRNTQQAPRPLPAFAQRRYAWSRRNTPAVT